MEFQAFNYIVALTNPPLVVCKQCQHAIWPREVRRHYYGKEHRLPKKIVDQVEVAIQGWDGLYQGPSRGGVIETDGLESIASPVVSNPHKSGKHWIPYQIGGQTRQGDSAVRRDGPGDVGRVSQRESGSILQRRPAND